MNDIIYMNRAWELALQGFGRTSPNPMVGAVVVKSGKIIAEGYHHYCGADHAEVDALKKAGAKARGATMYVTLEPCGHVGRTPPCTQAILNAGIKRLVAGASDPNPLNNGKSLKYLKKKGLRVEHGLLSEELTQMNEAFNSWITRQRPFVTAKAAQTIDGKSALNSGVSQWITSAAARDYAHRLRFGFDAIMVGSHTVLKDDPKLATIPAKRIKKIILDTDGTIKKHAQLFKGTLPEDVFVFTRRNAPLQGGKIDLKWVLGYLGQRQVTSVLIEGGPSLVGDALSRGLVDKMMVYIAPKIMGEGKGSVQGIGCSSLNKMICLKNMTIDKIGEDLLIQGYPHVHGHR